MKVRTNNVPREVETDSSGDLVFRYKGQWYNLLEFGRINQDPTDPHSVKVDQDHPWYGWQGYQMDPGGWTIPPLLIKFVAGDRVVVGVAPRA